LENKRQASGKKQKEKQDRHGSRRSHLAGQHGAQLARRRIQDHRFQSGHGAREPLIANGAQFSASPRDATTPDGGVLTMLANDLALESVALGEDGFIDALGKDGLYISMSTLSPETSCKFAAEHARSGSHFPSSAPHQFCRS
jgi:3-hydroxyisobutyrate dehydrogenase-like beta-hydroxyacid dehydrogenase